MLSIQSPTSRGAINGKILAGELLDYIDFSCGKLEQFSFAQLFSIHRFGNIDLSGHRLP